MTSRLIALAAALLIVGGCSGGDGESDQPDPREATSSAPALSEAEMISRAETAVEAVLPDAPIWEGVKFTGIMLDATTVCVDRTYPPGGGLDDKGGSAGYVTVTFPEETLGEPLDGVCKDAVVPQEEPAQPPVDVPDDLKGEDGLITRDDLGDEWPLTVPYGVMSCKNQIVTFTAPDDTKYALNGAAKSHTDLPNIDPVWADDPDFEGLKVDIGTLIQRALDLCD